MSSVAVRTAIKAFLTTNAPSETVVDLTSQFQDLRELLTDYSVAADAPWLGLQFIGGNSIPISLAATNDQGCYRESGVIVFHFCTIARLGNGDALLTRGENLINLLEGRNIEGIIVEEMTLMNFDAGATLQFEGGYVSGSFQLSYIYDKNL